MMRAPNSERVDHMRESQNNIIEESIRESPRKDWEETMDSKQNLTMSDKNKVINLSKHKPKVSVVQSNESYEDDEFDSASISKSIQKPLSKVPTSSKVEEEITCFDCHQKILRSQAGIHRKTC